MLWLFVSWLLQPLVLTDVNKTEPQDFGRPEFGPVDVTMEEPVLNYSVTGITWEGNRIFVRDIRALLSFRKISLSNRTVLDIPFVGRRELNPVVHIDRPRISLQKRAETPGIPITLPSSIMLSLRSRGPGRDTVSDFANRQGFISDLHRAIDIGLQDGILEGNFITRVENGGDATAFLNWLLNREKSRIYRELRLALKREAERPAFLANLLREADRFVPEMESGEAALSVAWHLPTYPARCSRVVIGQRLEEIRAVQLPRPDAACNATVIASEGGFNLLWRAYRHRELPEAIRITPRGDTEIAQWAQLFPQSSVDPRDLTAVDLVTEGVNRPVFRFVREAGESRLHAGLTLSAVTRSTPASVRLNLVFAVDANGLLTVREIRSPLDSTLLGALQMNIARIVANRAMREAMERSATRVEWMDRSDPRMLKLSLTPR